MDTCLVMGARQGFTVVHGDSPLVHVIECFWASGAEHAAVVDGSWRLLAVLSVRDILGLVSEAFEEQGLVEVSRIEGIFRLKALDVASKPPYYLRAGASLEDAVCSMAEKGIGFIPLVDGDGRLVGGYTEADVAPKMEYSSEPAIRYATRRVIILDDSSPLIEAIGFMASYRVRRIPVISSSGTLIAYVNDVLYNISLGGVGAFKPLRELNLPLAPVIEPGASLGEAARIIGRSRVKAAVIVDDGKPAAIITERDLLNTYAERLAC